MNKLENLIRRLIPKLDKPLNRAKESIENSVLGNVDVLHEDEEYVNIIESENIIREMREELGMVTTKRYNSSKFKQKTIFDETGE